MVTRDERCLGRENEKQTLNRLGKERCVWEEGGGGDGKRRRG